MAKLPRRARLVAIIKKLDHHGERAIDTVLRQYGLSAFADEIIEEIAAVALENRDRQIISHRASRAHYAAQRAAAAKAA